MKLTRLTGAAALLGVVLAFSACATTTRTGGGDRDVLTSEQLGELEGEGYTAYDAVRQLRPTWMRTRGRGTSPREQSPMVYVNRVRVGSVEELRQIRVEEVQELRYLDPADATMKLGTNHTGGAIMVSLRQG